MLKFIRKYQLFILAIGGSLLMVVFLLEPVITRLSPSPGKAKVATLASGTKITRADIQMADFELNVIGRINQRMFAPVNQGGIGLDPDDSKRSMQWLLMSREATNAGLVGDAADGRAWINEIAQTEAFVVARQEAMQGLLPTENAEQRMTELSSLINAQLNRTARSAVGAIPGYTEDDIFRSLAKGRGVYRLRNLYENVPAFSDLGAIAAAHDSYDAVAVNAAVIPGSLLADSIADPTDEQLQAFFDEYKDQHANESEFGIGYQQPTRVRLAYLMMDRNALMNAVEIDLVELIKIKRQNPELYPGDDASERPNIERQYRLDKSNEMLIDADRVIRGLINQSVKGLPTEEGVVQLPDDWDTRRPQLETLADAVVTELQTKYSTTIPTPTIEIFGSGWFDAGEISAIENLGGATYRVGGAQPVPVYAIPALLAQPINNSGLIIQPGLPMADPAATDANGSRYYTVVLDINDAGPADSIDDAGRQRVINDYKEIRGYEQLIANADDIRSAIGSTGDTQSGVDAALALAIETTLAPQIQRNILVSKGTIKPGRLAPYVNPALNTDAFRTAVLESASALSPLTPPEAIDNASKPITVPLAASKSLALGSIVAPRPMTTEQFRVQSAQVLQTQTVDDLVSANESKIYPFSYDSLAERFGLVKAKSNKDKEES